MNDLEQKFYEEVRDAIKSFAQYAVDGIKGEGDIEHSAVQKELLALRELSLTDSNLENLKKVIEDAIVGAVHSIFVSIDGGTAISDNGRALNLVDAKTGVPITQGALHENFMDVIE